MTVLDRRPARAPSVAIEPFPRQRLHTLFFLRHARSTTPVFLDTDVDMSRVVEHRERARSHGWRYSFVSYVVLAAAKVMLRHPQANSAICERRFGGAPRVARYAQVHAKLALDKILPNGQRIVAAALLPNLQNANLEDIQRQIDHYRDTAVEQLPEMRGLLSLHRLPAWLGGLAFSLLMRRLHQRHRMLGTFAVSSLGHLPIHGFHALGGAPVTLNMSQVRESPVVKRGALAVAPVMRLNLCFDHRVLDGADAAEMLTELKTCLEQGQGWLMGDTCTDPGKS
jgi:pyruvate/2-oxoglutarate dehydrogenase complex dihydrolipoamide acyltransferase (E2) component